MKPDSAPSERLQKLLANAGFGSRRQLEEMISAGRITVNGSVARLGDRATRDDRIEIDGRPVGSKRLDGSQRFVIIYNKPEGELVTRRDPDGRKTVFNHLPHLPTGRWIAVGRLDVNSAGLLLFTNDGELANRLMHPRYQIDREYAVRVNGEVTPDMVQQLVNGVELEDGPARFEHVVEAGGEGSNRWFHLVIMEGRKREVRRLWEAVGATVSRLKRVRYGPIILDSSVRVGQWRELNAEERRDLLKTVDLKDRRPWGSLARRPAARKPAAAGSPWKKPRRR
jgi:23S rRNA pseudouridine2605 synthase